MASAAELFKQPLFIVKFVELVLILILFIFFSIWYGYEGYSSDYFNHIAYACYFSILSSLFPVVVMFGIHCAEGDFPEKKYEMIIAILGAICAGLGAIFLLVACYDDHDRQSNNRYYGTFVRDGGDGPALQKKDVQSNKNKYERETQRQGRDSKTGCVVLAVFMLGICATFIADAILSAGA